MRSAAKIERRTLKNDCQYVIDQSNTNYVNSHGHTALSYYLEGPACSVNIENLSFKKIYEMYGDSNCNSLNDLTEVWIEEYVRCTVLHEREIIQLLLNNGANLKCLKKQGKRWFFQHYSEGFEEVKGIFEAFAKNHSFSNQLILEICSFSTHKSIADFFMNETLKNTRKRKRKVSSKRKVKLRKK